MIEHSVTLRILSHTLRPSDVSRIVGLHATYERVADGTGRAQGAHVWEFGRPPRDADFATLTMELLQALAPYEAGLRAVQDEAELVLWTASFSDAPEVTLRLPVEALHRLAALGIELSASVYATA